MLSYRHAFHAGNHADVLKHISLMLVLESFRKKEKPFIALDCHAGAGLYKIDDERALKTGEIYEGVLKLLQENNENCELQGENKFSNQIIENYLSFVKNYTQKNLYPGSPEIIRHFLREQDRAILMELHNTEIDVLRSNIRDEKIAIHHRSCFEGLKALTPPQIKRGFLLVDPSYEVDSDYTNVSQSLCDVQKRWNVAVQCLWYPLLKHRKIDLEMMLDKIQTNASIRGLESFNVELKVSSSENDGLYGSGMLFVNPPWKLKENLESIIPILEENLKIE